MLPAVTAADRLRSARAEAELLLARLTGGFDDLVEASRSSNADDEHDPEGATIAFERSQLDALLQQVRRRLADIDTALERIHEGRYGVCERCGGAITEARLEARPVARTCIACAGRDRSPGARSRA